MQLLRPSPHLPPPALSGRKRRIRQPQGSSNGPGKEQGLSPCSKGGSAFWIPGSASSELRFPKTCSPFRGEVQDQAGAARSRISHPNQACPRAPSSSRSPAPPAPLPLPPYPGLRPEPALSDPWDRISLLQKQGFCWGRFQGLGGNDQSGQFFWSSDGWSVAFVAGDAGGGARPELGSRTRGELTALRSSLDSAMGRRGPG